MSNIIFRWSSRSGRYVVVGPVAEMAVGPVTARKADKTLVEVEIEQLGTPFEEDGVEKVYGYIRSAIPPRPGVKRKRNSPRKAAGSEA